jgi:general secretion pathway protein I
VKSRTRTFARGFTLVEVMVALAVLGIALAVLIRSTTRNIHETEESRALLIVTELARAKMYDVEEQLQKDGFQETDQSSEGDFEDDEWPDVTWQAKVEQVEIPSFDQIQQMAQAAAAGSGSGSGDGSGSAAGGFGDTALGGMLGMLGGGTDAADAAGGAFIQGQFQLVQEVLKASIRKVTLTVKYKVMGYDRDLVVVAYFTDPAGMNKVIGSLGSTPVAGGESGGTTGGTGAGSGTSPTRPGTGGGGK